MSCDKGLMRFNWIFKHFYSLTVEGVLGLWWEEEEGDQALLTTTRSWEKREGGNAADAQR